MHTELTLTAAFLVGLLGSTHCAGMCGSIVSTLSLSLDPAASRTRKVLFSLLYNTGRIASYALAGAASGYLGQALLSLTAQQTALLTGRLLSAFFLAALGLSISGLWSGLRYLEKAGHLLWRRIEPLGRRVFPVDTPRKALLLGALWGWLPCGMVYSMLAWSLASGRATDGSLLMAAFGLGTLPALLLMGSVARQLTGWLQNRTVRLTIGLSLITLAVVAALYTLYAAPAHHAHGKISLVCTAQATPGSAEKPGRCD